MCSKMAKNLFTSEQIKAVNRGGGLFVVNDGTFELFKFIEVKMKQLLPQHMAGIVRSSKEELVKTAEVDGRLVSNALAERVIVVQAADLLQSKTIMFNFAMWEQVMACMPE